MFIIFLFADDKPQTLQDYAWVLALLVFTNLVQWLISRRKSQSEMANLDAQTVAQYLKSIKEIQESNTSLFDKMLVLRQNFQKVEHDLEECLERNESCDECSDLIKSAHLVLTEVSESLSKVTEADVLIEKVDKLTKKMARKLNDGDLNNNLEN